ncbi:hypothetical protein [Pseudomonas sp. B22129]|uniref:hypothetical protein n=1 Tax=Pseudomonas sp. B22129 TaxID=3235111 RepID=UPI0037832EC4
MNSTSFKSCQTRSCETVHSGDNADQSVAIKAEETSPLAHDTALASGYATETRPMKTFASQRQFQAPVSEDFVRGMLEVSQPNHTDAKPTQPGSAWAALAKGFMTWWRGQKPD